MENTREINEKIEQTREALELKEKQLADCNNKYDVSMEKIQEIGRSVSFIFIFGCILTNIYFFNLLLGC